MTFRRLIRLLLSQPETAPTSAEKQARYEADRRTHYHATGRPLPETGSGPAKLNGFGF